MTTQGKQTPHYDNGLMLDRHGRPLSTVALTRQQWYLDRGLAVEVTDYPDKRFARVIKLTFQHAGNEVRESDLVLVENQCVVCGATEHLSLHHVTPYRIKRMFRRRDKENTRALCCLVCPEHHAAAEVEAHKVPDAHAAFSGFVKTVTGWLHRGLALLRYPYFWAWSLRHGGVEGVNRMYAEAFLRLKPKYLPKGWLK